MKLSLLIALALLTPLILAERSGADDSKDPPVVPGVLLVRYHESSAPPAVASARTASYNQTLDLWRIAVDEGEISDVEESLRADPTVALVQPQYVYQHAAEPDDPLYAAKQHVHYRTINLQAAWDMGAPPTEVVVAVIDGGVDVDHPELAGRTWVNAGETANGLDDDANGCVDDLAGCSFQAVTPDGDIGDRDGHGTFVSGIIGAQANNGQGIAGVAQNARIMPVRALDPNGAGTTEQLTASILYAARNGADILNLSLVLPPIGFTCPTDAVVEAALQEAVDVHGATVVAASGNFGIDCVGYPGSSQYTIAVGGSGPAESSDSHAPFAQWGPEVDVAAPAERLVSACPEPTPQPTPYCPGTPYGEGDGTSFSTPTIAGVAALLLGGNPAMSPVEVRQVLMDTARDVPDEDRPNWDGAGIVDAGAALGDGSVWSSMDARGDDLSSLTLRVIAGDPDAPDCEAVIWGAPDFSVKETASTFGVGECAPFWPPTPGQPWTLAALSTGHKANVISGWSLRSGGLSCSAADLPLFAPVGVEVQVSIDCTESGVVINDAPTAAQPVSNALPRRYQQDVRYATAVAEQPSSCGPTSRTVWFRVPAAVAGSGLTVDTYGSDFDSVLTVYKDDGGVLTEVACNDDFRSPQSRANWKGDGTSDYLVKAGAYGSFPAIVIRVNFSRTTVPANDDSASPVTLMPTSGVMVQPAHSASTGPADPNLICTGLYGYTVWFSVTAETAGPMTIRTTGSTYDTVLSVLDGPAEIACNDEEGGGLHTSLASWTAEAGKVYSIVVGSYLAGPAGVLHLEVTAGP